MVVETADKGWNRERGNYVLKMEKVEIIIFFKKTDAACLTSFHSLPGREEVLTKALWTELLVLEKFSNLRWMMDLSNIW